MDAEIDAGNVAGNGHTGGALASRCHVPTTFADSIIWSDMCTNVFEWILANQWSTAVTASGRGGKKKPWQLFSLELGPRVFPEPLRTAVRRGQSIFPYATLLMPSARSVGRLRYNMKQVRLGECLAKAYGLPHDSVDAKKLRNYKDASVLRHGKADADNGSSQDDFAAVVYVIARERASIAVAPPWTIGQVTRWLDALSAAPDDAARVELFKEFVRISPLEQKWLVRIIIGELKLGIEKEKILDLYHPCARDRYSSHMDLRAIFEAPDLRDKSCVPTTQPLLEIDSRFTVCLAKEAQLGSGGSHGAVPDWQKWPDLVIEDKLDGERVHAHIVRTSDGSLDVHMYSRRNEEYSDYARVMKPHLLLALRGSTAAPVTRLILDGEMMTYDENLGRFGAFSDNRDAAALMLHNPNSRRHLRFIVFDIVYIDGWVSPPSLPGQPPWPADLRGDITSRLLVDRKRILSALLTGRGATQLYVDVVKSQLVSGEHKRKAVWEALELAISESKEGIMLKNAASTYVLGRTSNWKKLKPEHAEDASQTLDLAIVGGYMSAGSRSGGDGISSFLVAVGDDNDRLPPSEGFSEGVSRVWYPVARVGSGYTFAQLSQLQSALSGKWVAVDKDAIRGSQRGLPVTYFGAWKCMSSDIPDFVVGDMMSEHATVVLEVKAASCCRGKTFPLGWSLRFPRVVSIRTDKPLSQVLSRSQFMGLTERKSLAVVPRDGKYRDADKRRNVSSQTAEKRSRTAGVSDAYATVDTTGIAVEAPALRKISVYLLPDRWDLDVSIPVQYRSRKNLQTLIARLGGNVIDGVMNCVAGTEIYVVGRFPTAQSLNYAQLGFRVMRPAWLLACWQLRALPPLEPAFVLHLTPRILRETRRTVDAFGDRHSTAVNEESLRKLVESMKSATRPSIASSSGEEAALVLQTTTTIADVVTSYGDVAEVNILVKALPFSLFFMPQIRAVVDVAACKTKYVLDECAILLEAYGGRVSDSLDERITAVFVADRAPPRIDELQKRAAEYKIPVLLAQWVMDSVAVGVQLPYSTYYVTLTNTQ